MVDAEELAKCFDADELRGYNPIRNFTREERRAISWALRTVRVSNACSMSAAMSSAQPTSTRSNNSSIAPVIEIPDSVRIPLHSLWADSEYLIGRVIADGSCGPMIVKSMRDRLDQIEAGVRGPVGQQGLTHEKGE
jgi:hypothetical protein